MIAQMKDKKKLRQKIRQAVCQMYEEVSTHPHLPFHFPVGKTAAEVLGYPKDVLNKIPPYCLESFAGVAYHFKTNPIGPGDTVLDIGSGSGTDLLIAGILTGKKGKVSGIDITDAMIAKAKKGVKTNGLANITIIKADAENLPFKTQTFDVVISNGVINLIPDKKKVFGEIFRVLKPNGIFNFADIVLGKAISEKSRQDPQLWAECIVGATQEVWYIEMIKQSGFEDIEVIERVNYFDFSPSQNTKEVANQYKAHSIIIKAKKGGE